MIWLLASIRSISVEVSSTSYWVPLISACSKNRVFRPPYSDGQGPDIVRRVVLYNLRRVLQVDGIHHFLFHCADMSRLVDGEMTRNTPLPCRNAGSRFCSHFPSFLSTRRAQISHGESSKAQLVALLGHGFAVKDLGNRSACSLEPRSACTCAGNGCHVSESSSVKVYVILPSFWTSMDILYHILWFQGLLDVFFSPCIQEGKKPCRNNLIGVFRYFPSWGCVKNGSHFKRTSLVLNDPWSSMWGAIPWHIYPSGFA